MKCILSSVYTMEADVLTQFSHGKDDNDPETGGSASNVDGQSGHWEYIQDEDSGALIRKWFPYTPPEDPSPDYEGPTRQYTFECIARGVIDGGIRVAGTTERFNRKGYIETVDYVSMKFPRDVLLTRRDRITNIRDKASQRMLWVEEEMAGTDGKPRPTVFEVNGVTPVIDPFGQHVENSVLLQRAEIQDG